MKELEIWEKEIGKMYGKGKSMKNMTYDELCYYRKELCENIQKETAKEIFKDIEKAYINENGVADCNKLEEELPRIAKKWSSEQRSDKNDM